MCRQATWASEPPSPGSPFSGTRDPADTTTRMGQREHFILQSAYSAEIGSKTWLHETYPLKVCLREQEGSLGFRQRVSMVNEASRFKARTRRWAPAGETGFVLFHRWLGQVSPAQEWVQADHRMGREMPSHLGTELRSTHSEWQTRHPEAGRSRSCRF